MAMIGSRGSLKEGEVRSSPARVVGEGPGVLLERKQEGIIRGSGGRDFEGGGGWGAFDSSGRDGE